MASSFNLNTFLQTYQQNTYDPTKTHAAAEANMEQKLVEQAEEAVKESGLLSLTLKEKLVELGIGERVMEQVADTAMGIVQGVVNPISDYLAKYENIFDENVYNAEIQSYAKQMFFSGQAMSAQAAENPDGQKFSYVM